jgi:hypothetical protein
MNDLVKMETLPPSLLKLQVNGNPENVADEIVLIMLEFQNFYNVKSKLDEYQLYDIAYMIMEEYRHLNLLDIGILFKYAKLGKYGKVYDRIDGGMVLDWVSQYEKARCEIIISNRESEHSQTKVEGTRTSESLPFSKFLKR